jgi:hypothetical protein
MNNGMIQLDGTEDNITISWMKTNHVPPNIPLLYQEIWTPLRQDPDVSNMKIYNLNTYSSTICGNAAFIGHWSFFDNRRKNQVNEGIIIWNQPSQDRFYQIDIASYNDYYSFVVGNLARYQESFKCAN